MTISKCEFSPPMKEGVQADVTVVLDGMLVLFDVSIIRERNSMPRKDCLSVLMPETMIFADEYTEQLFTNEILDRYGDWLDEQRRLLGRDEDLALL